MSGGSIPKTIKIGGVEYTIDENPELLSLVTAVRKEEKDKLYSRISTLEQDVKVLQNEKDASGKLTKEKEEELKKLTEELAAKKVDMENVTKELEGLKKSGEKSEKKPQESKEDMEKNFEELLEKKLAEKLKSIEEANKKELDSVKTELSAKKIKDYREKLIAKYADLIIEDFVPTGLSTEEEVDKAVEAALKKSKKYITKDYEIEKGKTKRMSLEEIEEFEKVKGEEDEKADKDTDTYKQRRKPEKPEGGDGDLTGKELISKLNEMGVDEFSKNRDAIAREIRNVKYGEE